jgi:hypothetical protein
LRGGLVVETQPDEEIPQPVCITRFCGRLLRPVGLDTAKNEPTRPTGLAMTDVVGICEISCYELRTYFRS